MVCSGAGESQRKGHTPVEITADGENRFEGGIAYAEGNVVVRYGDDIIYADEIRYAKDKAEITARGNVRIYTDGQIFRGEMISYNLESRAISSLDFRTARDRVYALGEEAYTPKEGVYVIEDGWFTTHNDANPSYRLQASTIEIYPDDHVLLKNVTVVLGNMPVFWLPIVSYSLDEGKTNFNFQVGSSSKWGFYGLSDYTITWNNRWTSDIYFDYRGRRGLAGGLDVEYHPRADDYGKFRGYYLSDRGRDIDNGDRLTIPPKSRYRFDYRQKFDIAEDLQVSADLNVWSDAHVAQDFFENEYLADRIPDNYVDAVYYDDNFTGSVLVRKQFNNLFEMTERKPEFSLEFKRQPIPYTPLYYEGESSMTNFEYVFDGKEPSTLGMRSYEAVRYDTFHQIVYPKQYMGWLSVTPRLGLRGTVYSHDNVGPDLEEPIYRGVFNAGLEASFKASKVWLDAKDERFAIDGLRHVFQPFVNAGYTLTPTERPTEFLGFDRRQPSTRARPINYTAFNSIDSIDKTLIIRHGVRNKIQTKRDGENVDLLDWAIYGDADLERNEGALVDQVYPEIYNELSLTPLPWLRLDLYSAAGLMGDSFNEINADLRWQVHPALELNVGQRYLNNFPIVGGRRLIDNSLFFSWGTFWRLNENWQVSSDLLFEAEDGRLQEQSYSLYRDLTHWNIAATAKFRSNRAIDDEYLLFLTFTLKAFPSASFSVGN